VVHTAFAGLAVLTAFLLGLTLSEWCLVMLCIAGVFAAEMFNSALESLAKAIDRQYNPHLADGLDIASAAVLISAAGAVVVGLLLFGTRLVGLMG
jgi:diacylglycerol kinase